jgi:citrate lyase subunit beta/citryl-CoA lyase
MAAARPGVHAVFLPKVMSGDDVRRVEALISRRERAQGIEEGTIRLSLHIESPAGVLRLEEIADASERIESMSMGVDDYRLEMAVEPSDDAADLLVPFSMLAVICRAVGANPIGVMGSVADFSDLAGFERAAARSRALGFSGAYCIHPDQVHVLNRVFSPSAEQVAHAKRVVEAFEQGLAAGRSSVNLDGRMVDTPVYKQAVRILELADAVAEREGRTDGPRSSI